MKMCNILTYTQLNKGYKKECNIGKSRSIQISAFQKNKLPLNI